MKLNRIGETFEFAVTNISNSIINEEDNTSSIGLDEFTETGEEEEEEKKEKEDKEESEDDILYFSSMDSYTQINQFTKNRFNYISYKSGLIIQNITPPPRSI